VGVADLPVFLVLALNGPMPIAVRAFLALFIAFSRAAAGVAGAGGLALLIQFDPEGFQDASISRPCGKW